MRRRLFGPASAPRPLTAADVAILLGFAAFLFACSRLALRAPRVVGGPRISLAARALPWYALLSLGRMAAAYVLSLAFSLFYAYVAARNLMARKVMMPLLDVLQSVPILSFLPVVVLSLAAILPEGLAAEIAAIILIFTSQAWNLTFSFYQSVTTIPTDLREAAAVFRFRKLLRFRTVELPFAAIPLVWNSMMSWAGGWFFLMAAEIFSVGTRDFRLPGLGSYLQTAANAGDLRAIALGVGMLLLVIVLLDQLLWRPLVAWTDRFRVEMTEGEEPPSSWFLELLGSSELLRRMREGVVDAVVERLDRRAASAVQAIPPLDPPTGNERFPLGWVTLLTVASAAALYGAWKAALLLAQIQASAWGGLALGLLATLLRVAASLLIAVLWTVPVGVWIGMDRRRTARLQPVVQAVASVPATALFPVLVLAFLRVPGGISAAAVLLMLLGTQWYVLFNVIAGTAAIPQDLRAMTDLLRLSRWDRWRTLILPALFPYLVTGAITASGGAWNASIVAEHVEFGGRTLSTTGVGAVIADATAHADYALLLAGTLALVSAVVLLNRFLWRRLYRVAEERYRLE